MLFICHTPNRFQKFASNAQDLNSKGDNILGNYLSIKDGGKSKIKITKAEDKNRRVRKRKTESPRQ
jgi:predicted RNA-binding protein with RPS1 domain